MAPTVRTSAVFASTSGSGSFTPSLTPQVGDLEVLFAIVPSSRTITAPAGQGWATAYSSVPDRILYVFYRIPTSATQSGAFTISGAANAANAYAQLLIVGYDPTTPIGPANATADTSSNSNIVSPSLTPNAAPSLYATLFIAVNPGTITLPGSMAGTGTGAGGASGYTVRGAWEALSGLSASGTRTATVSVTGPTEAVAVLIRPANVTPAGIASAEAFGTAVLSGGPVTATPTGIASAEAFGTALLAMGIVLPSGIASGEAFGTTAIAPGSLDISPAGIASAEAFGTLGFTITLNPAVRAARPRGIQATYELLVIARINQPSGKPLLLQVDPIEGWTTLAYTEQLSTPTQLNVGVKLTTITEPIVQRLRALHELATEIHLYRNGRLVFAGPLVGYEVQNEALTFNAQSAMYYMRWMVITADLVFKQIDQFTIVKTMVDAWQNMASGNFGLDTSGIKPSGVLRDATYLKTELDHVYETVLELAKGDQGFDFSVDPATRALQLWYPQQGVNRSSGADAIVIDAASITNRNIICSVGVNDVASESFATGASPNQVTFYSTKSNSQLRSNFGRVGVTATFSTISDQPTLDSHAQGLLNARNAALMIPGPDVRVTMDADISSYNIGDTVQYQLHDRLNIRGNFRLHKRTVKVGATGQELVTLEFV